MSTVSIDYKDLKELVLQELAVDGPGGMMAPSAPAGIPFREPAAEPTKDTGDEKANKMYDLALTAREATEKLVEALDEPIFDDSYEHAFKASACLRRALNALESAGADPEPTQRVVAPDRFQQKFGTPAGGRGWPSAWAGGGVAGLAGPMVYNEIEGDAGSLPPDVNAAVEAFDLIKDEEERKLFFQIVSGLSAVEG